MRRRKVKYMQPQGNTPEQDLHDISIMEDNDLIMQVFTTPFRKETRPPQLLDGWLIQQNESPTLQKYHSNMIESRTKISCSPMPNRNVSAKIQRYDKMDKSAVLLAHQHYSFQSKKTQKQQLSPLLKLYSSRQIKLASFPLQHIYLKKRTGFTNSGNVRRQRLSVQAVSYPIMEMMMGNPEKRVSSIGKVRQLMQVKKAQRT